MFLKRLYCILFILLIPSFVLAQNIKPSFKQGFARSAAESKYPDLWRGLVGAWATNLGCTGITTLHDVSGRRNNGTLNGSMTQDNWVIGRNGYALDFDGTDDYVNVGNHSTIRTVAFWMKHNSPLKSYSIPFSWGTNQWVFLLNSAGLLTYKYDGTNANLKSGILVDQWYFIVGTFDGSNRKGYANGVLESGPLADTANDSIDGMFIGAHEPAGTNPWDGLIDDVRIYNRALTSQEIKFLYENSMALFQLKPRVYKAPAAAGGVRRVIIISKLLEQRIFKGYDFIFKED